jgi:hypothetical protein
MGTAARKLRECRETCDGFCHPLYRTDLRFAKLRKPVEVERGTIGGNGLKMGADTSSTAPRNGILSPLDQR